MTAKVPMQIVELRQPRCGRRFGVYPCPGSTQLGVSRTNDFLWSEVFSNAYWTKFNSSITANIDASPDGLLTADRLVENAANAVHSVLRSISFTAGLVYTASIFVKAVTRSRVEVIFPAAAFGTTPGVRIDATTGGLTALGGATQFAAQDIGSGWWRVWVQATATATAAGNVSFRLHNGTSATYLGDGASYALIWGAQIETGAGMSTYKPTTTATVTALWGTSATPCWNTWGTCPTAATKAAFANTGRTRWRFAADRPGPVPFGDFSNADDIATHPIRVKGLSVGRTKSAMNVAGILEGKSPFGVRASYSVTMEDFRWSDEVGDYNAAARGTLPARMFWAVMQARDPFIAGWEMVVYDGYEGDTLAAMRQSLSIVEAVDGPSNGRVTVRGIDPLGLADGKRALFPPAVDVKLRDAITAVQTTAVVTALKEADLSDVLGLTTGRFVLIGSEIIGYSGYTTLSPGVVQLNGLLRGQGGSTAATAQAGARVGRVGRFENARLTDSARYLLEQRTQVGAARIDGARWDDEADYLEQFRSDTWIVKPTPVVDLMGEICQQGMFSVWWDEYMQKVGMQAVRPPPVTPPLLTWQKDILKDSAGQKPDPKARLTRIFVYHAPIDATSTDAKNFQKIEGQIEGEGERAEVGGDARTLEIFARWVGSDLHAQQLIARIFLRYRTVPRFLSLHVSAKDRALTVGDVLDAQVREVVDADGNVRTARWQVISWAEVTPGEVYLLDCQSFDVLGRFGRWMADAAPTYGAATDTERQTGAWWADDDGLLGDGSPGYQWQ